MRHFTFSLFFLFLSLPGIQSQPGQPCGTPPEKSEWLTRFQQNPAAYESSGEILYVPITLHFVGDDEGAGYLPLQEALDQLCRLNEYFEEAQIQFFLEGTPQYLNNSEWYQGNQHSSMTNNNVDSTINCYIIQKGPNYSGYANIGGNVVVLTRQGFGWPPLFAHEVGHALSLYHTFLGWEGQAWNFSIPAPDYINGHKVERVDGLDCDIAGDGFCDTPPDYLSASEEGLYICTPNGESVTVQTDPTGAAFRSDCSLIMSYALNSSRFSGMQIRAMRADLEQARPYLLYQQNPFTDLPETKLDFVTP
ncbi:MAG: hypothetical protein J5I98_07620, partial [Phaeodactylibacter sp.]|nr:hypothetical protein [Phaeodactylibacter sp.]